VNKNARDLLISLVALAVIVFGIRYHIMRERQIFKRFECRVIPCVGTKLQVASTRRGRGLLCLSVYGRIWEA